MEERKKNYQCVCMLSVHVTAKPIRMTIIRVGS